MALAATTQVIEDGPRNLVLRLTADDTIGPTEVSSIFPGWHGSPLATSFAIKRVVYDLGDATSVVLAWDADTDVAALNLNGWGELDFTETGFIQNNAGAGKTGVLNVTKTGSGSMSMILWLIKQNSFLPTSPAVGQGFSNGFDGGFA